MAVRTSIDVQVTGRQTGTALASIQHQGTRYIVAEAGEEFQVKVQLNSNGHRDHRVSVSIDGRDVGYCKIIHSKHRYNEAVFEGFLQQKGGSNAPTLYSAFRFGACKPSAAAAVVEHPDEIKAGVIAVVCEEVRAVGQRDPTAPIKAVQPGNDAEMKKLPEGKKWFLAPGLKAEAGGTVASQVTWGTTVYHNVRTIATIKLRYDTAENLVLRKILDPSKPQHRDILRRAKDTRIAAMGQQQNDVSSRPQLSSRVKREGLVGVKRERDDAGPVVPPSASAQTVDLTGAVQPGPLMVDGQALQPDQVAVCDLCDSDDAAGDHAPAAGKWTVQRKEAIDV